LFSFGKAMFFCQFLAAVDQVKCGIGAQVGLNEQFFEFVPGGIINFSGSKKAGHFAEGNVARLGKAIPPFLDRIIHRQRLYHSAEWLLAS
jgi:hypothetical protein